MQKDVNWKKKGEHRKKNKKKKKKEDETKKWKKMKIFLENQEMNYISVWDDIVEYDSGYQYWCNQFPTWI